MNLDIKNLKKTLLSLKHEKLEVDYVSLNIPMKGEIDPTKLGYFLFKYGFNSKVLEDEKAPSKKFIVSQKNYHEVIFVKSSYNPSKEQFWNGLKVRFAGSNGAFFYDLLKQNKIKFESLPVEPNSIRLGRLDLCYCLYFCPPEIGKRSAILEFFMDCKKKFEGKFPSQRVSIARKSLKLTAPMRKGAKRYYRIYEKINHLRFELEMRQECFKYCRNSFFSYSFEEFEDTLVGLFIGEFKVLCPLDSAYSNWLLLILRKKSALLKRISYDTYLISLYNLNFSQDLEFSYNCLQLASFIQRKEIQKYLNCRNLAGRVLIKFSIVDFLKFTGKNARSTAHREKACYFFENLYRLEPIKLKMNENRFEYFTPNVKYTL